MKVSFKFAIFALIISNPDFKKQMFKWTKMKPILNTKAKVNLLHIMES
jgi:hypothetical protein